MTNNLHISLLNNQMIGYANLWAVCEEGVRGSE